MNVRPDSGHVPDDRLGRESVAGAVKPDDACAQPLVQIWLVGWGSSVA